MCLCSPFLCVAAVARAVEPPFHTESSWWKAVGVGIVSAFRSRAGQSMYGVCHDTALMESVCVCQLPSAEAFLASWAQGCAMMVVQGARKQQLFAVGGHRFPVGTTYGSVTIFQHFVFQCFPMVRGSVAGF